MVTTSEPVRSGEHMIGNGRRVVVHRQFSHEFVKILWEEKKVWLERNKSLVKKAEFGNEHFRKFVGFPHLRFFGYNDKTYTARLSKKTGFILDSPRCEHCGLVGCTVLLEQDPNLYRQHGCRKNATFNVYGKRENSPHCLVLLTIDHIIPKAKGGKNTYSNYQVLCQPCNNKKGSSLPSGVKFPRNLNGRIKKNLSLKELEQLAANYRETRRGNR